MADFAHPWGIAQQKNQAAAICEAPGVKPIAWHESSADASGRAAEVWYSTAAGLLHLTATDNGSGMGAELTLWNDVPTPKISAVGHPNVNAPELKIEIVRLGLAVSADADADKKWNRLSPWQFVEDVLSKLKSRTEGPAT